MLVTKDILDRAGAAKARALDYLQQEEPLLFNEVQKLLDTGSAQIADLVRNMGGQNPMRVAQLFIDRAKDALGLPLMASLLSQDIMLSKSNPQLNLLVKAGHKSTADVVADAQAGVESDEETDTLSAAAKKVRGKEKDE